MIKKFNYITLVFLLFGSSIFAQNNLSSPYSRYGIGQLNNRNTIFCTSMGGLGQAIQMPFVINSANPASYNAIDTLGFIVDGSLVAINTKSQTESLQQTAGYSSLGNFNVGFTVYKGWKTAIGILPFSDVGYKISSAGTDSSLGTHTYRYNGNGGLTQVYWGNSLRITRGLSIGLNTSYLFGSINKERIVEFKDMTILGLNTKSKTYINGFQFLLGAQYKKSFKNDYYLVLGATTGLTSSLNATDDVLTTSFLLNSTSSYITKDTIENFTNKSGKIELPLSAGGGLTFGKEDKFLIGMDMNWQNWSKYSIFNVNDSLSDSYQISIGGMYVVNPQSAKFLQKIRYRAGIRYAKSYLELKNSNINDFGINFGVSIPLRKKNSLNIGVEFGQKGTISNNLIKETYTRVFIGFQLWDNMFVRRKLD
ncbi:MAG: hypothetical protein WCP69_00525 [Bacteroidota bacterium]